MNYNINLEGCPCGYEHPEIKMQVEIGRGLLTKSERISSFFVAILIVAIYFINAFLFWLILRGLFVIIFINIFILAHCLVIYMKTARK